MRSHTTTSRRLGIAAVGLTALATVSGCGADNDSSAPTAVVSGPENETSGPSAIAQERPEVDATVVGGSAEYDYDAAPSVVALMQRSEEVVLGEVVGWREGRSVVEGYPDRSYTDTEAFALLELRVVSTYKSADGYDGSESIYLEVPRGGEVREDGELPEGTESNLTTIEELDQAVPAGTRVIIAGSAASSSAPQRQPGRDILEIRRAPEAPPEGSLVIWPDIQGLLLEEQDGDFVSGITPGDEDSWGWTPTSARQSLDEFDYLVEQLDNVQR